MTSISSPKRHDRHFLRAVQSAQDIPVISSDIQSDPIVLDLRLRNLDEGIAGCVSSYQAITANECALDKRYKESYNNLVAKYNSVESELARLGTTPEGFEKAVRKLVRKEIDKTVRKRVDLDEVWEMMENRYALLKNRVEDQAAKNCNKIDRLITEVKSMDQGFDEDDPRYSLTEERIDYLMIELQKIAV